LNRFGALKSSLHFFNCVETALSGSLLGATWRRKPRACGTHTHYTGGL